MSAPGQAEVRDPALRTPTSTHFLCSEGLASHVRGRPPAWEENIAISPRESRLQNPQALRPKPPGRDRQPRSAQSRKLSFARHLQRPLSLDNLRATGVDPAALLARDFVWLRFLGTAYGREALRPAPSPGSAPPVSPPGLGHVLAQALFHCVLRDSSHFLFPHLAVFTFDNFDQRHYARHHKRHKSVNKA